MLISCLSLKVQRCRTHNSVFNFLDMWPEPHVKLRAPEPDLPRPSRDFWTPVLLPLRCPHGLSWGHPSQSGKWSIRISPSPKERNEKYSRKREQQVQKPWGWNHSCNWAMENEWIIYPVCVLPNLCGDGLFLISWQTEPSERFPSFRNALLIKKYWTRFDFFTSIWDDYWRVVKGRLRLFSTGDVLIFSLPLVLQVSSVLDRILLTAFTRIPTQLVKQKQKEIEWSIPQMKQWLGNIIPVFQMKKLRLRKIT